ncbi:MAG: hypothetical protein Q8P90_00530 [bacterium]|nr:hypothetical protein [bacterium]
MKVNFSFKTILSICAVLLLVGFLNANPQPTYAVDDTIREISTLPRLGRVKGVKINQNVTTQKIRVSWNKTKRARKFAVKVKQGNTVLVAKKTKRTYIKFKDSKLTHNESYSVRVRALKTNTSRKSLWRKKAYTFEDKDRDDDLINDSEDTDDDNDGILDVDDTYPFDHDNDGIDDHLDDDDDNDLISDVNDDYPFDHDNDGIPDSTDPDDDGDGINDVDEVVGQQFDDDNDGTPDITDPDYIEEHIPNPIIYTINITSSGFSGGDITIAVNDYVKWTNKDEIAGHVIAAADTSWTSQPLTFGDSFTKVFTSAGIYPYQDPTRSDTFSGTITVQ